MKATEFLQIKYDKSDCSTHSILKSLDALQVESLINLMEEYAKSEVDKEIELLANK